LLVSQAPFWSVEKRWSTYQESLSGPSTAVWSFWAVPQGCHLNPPKKSTAIILSGMIHAYLGGIWFGKMHNNSSLTALHTATQRDYYDSSQQRSNRRQNNRSWSGCSSIHPGLLGVGPHLLGVCNLALILHLSGLIPPVLRGSHTF